MKSMRVLAGEYFKGKKMHVKSDCIISYDIEGRCVDYEIKKDELILLIDTNGKILKVGENQALVSIEFI